MKKKGMAVVCIGLIMILFFAVMQFTQEDTKGVRINRLENNTGRRVAICIGINDYEDKSIIDLEKARNDAKELGNVLEVYGQFTQVYVMTDDLDLRGEYYPRLSNIKRKMAFLKGLLDPDDLVVFSFSGHGVSNGSGEGFLLTADSYGDDLYGSSLKVNAIIQWLKELKVKKSLLLLDACRDKLQEAKGINLNGLKAERFSKAEVGAVFYSTRSGWFSYEDKKGDFGVFTRFLIEGLKGKADSKTGNNDGIVSFLELSSYVDEEVAGWALKESKKQRPYTQLIGEKFGDIALSAYVIDDKPAAVKAAEAKALRVYKNDKGFWEADYGEGIIMVYIPAGEFTIGSNNGEENEKPVHVVYLDGYWLGKTEVTVKQFRAFVIESKYLTEAEKDKGIERWQNPGFEQADNHPVVNVNWNVAVKYCEWLSKTKGVTFQLPTEAQWEKGARGTDGREYPWGNHEPFYNGKYYANYDPGNYTEDGYEYTSPVGSYSHGASVYGLLDMAGNAWEWCQDWYKEDYYKSSPSKNPLGPGNSAFRVLRGGSWFDGGRNVRSAVRGRLVPSSGFRSSGFRLARGQE